MLLLYRVLIEIGEDERAGREIMQLALLLWGVMEKTQVYSTNKTPTFSYKEQ